MAGERSRSGKTSPLLTKCKPKMAFGQHEALLASDWYRDRLTTKQQRDIAAEQLARVQQPEYMTEFVGTLGAEPFL